MTTDESEGCPGDPVGKIQGVEEETVSVAAADSRSSPGTGTSTFRIEGGRQAPSEAKDGGNKMSCLAGDVLKYDDSEGGLQAPDEDKDGRSKMSCLAVDLHKCDGDDDEEDDDADDHEAKDGGSKLSCLAGDLPKYDDSDGDEDDDADGHELEGDDDRVKGCRGKHHAAVYDMEKNKSRGKHHAAVHLDAEMVNRSCLLLVSLLLLVAMPFEARRSSGHPLILVWRLSLLLCSCCGIWTGLLAITMSAQTVFLRIALVLALALYVDAAVDPKIGILMVYLNSHFAAGMMGYALAECRQHDGAELSAMKVCIPSDKKKANTLFGAQVLGGAYFSLITIGFAFGVGWVVFHAADYAVADLILSVFFPVSVVSVLWITYVGSMLLQGRFIADIGCSLLVTYLFLIILICIWCGMVMGTIWSMVFTWPLMLGLSGVFGYSICVHTMFRLRMKLGLPAVNPNETKAAAASLRMLLEMQRLGSNGLYPGSNNIMNSSFVSVHDISQATTS